MFLLVGLGNPGNKYALTRHNAGFLVVEALARMAKVRFSRLESQARVAQATIAGAPVLLAKPQTYMNASGLAVAGLLRNHHLSLPDLVVIADDLDLPLGALRFRKSGGSGGHHGLDSIIATLGTECFARLKLGVGRPEEDAVDHVLGSFRREEAAKFEAAVARAGEAILVFLREGPEAVMNGYNRTVPEP